jgi:hypothetical protein
LGVLLTNPQLEVMKIADPKGEDLVGLIMSLLMNITALIIIGSLIFSLFSQCTKRSGESFEDSFEDFSPR